MRKAFVILLGVAFAVACTSGVEAQRKKKGKEPELAICKRGKLIFEDDFSGKELEWSVVSGEWKIQKKALVTTSKKAVQGETCPAISRPFLEVPDVVLEFRILLPRKGSVLVLGRTGSSNAENPSAAFSTIGKRISIYYSAEPSGVNIAMRPFVYPKPMWLDVVFEMFGNTYAVTVDNKTIQGEAPPSDSVKRSAFLIWISSNPDGELFAIDDVKVYEALPKDEPEDKDEKGKKKN